MKEEKNAERKGKQGRDRVKQAHTHTHPPKRIKYGGCYLLFYECFELFPNNAIHIYVYNDAHTLSITWSRFFPSRWKFSLIFLFFFVGFSSFSSYSHSSLSSGINFFLLYSHFTSKAVKLWC